MEVNMATRVLDHPVPAAGPLTPSKARLWSGRVLTGIPTLFLLFDSITKLIKIQPVTDTMRQLGWPDYLARPLGGILLVCTLLYALPRTAVLGALLLTAWLGGALATPLRGGAPLAGFTLFPVYLALMLWGGLYLRDERLSALLPLRSDR